MFEFLNVKYKQIIDIRHLCIHEHKITTLTGISGSGKTTILKMLNKIISPTQGKVMFENRCLDDIDSTSLRRRVTMLSQHPSIFEGNIRENLIIGLIFQERRIPPDEFLKQILEKVKLNKALGEPASTLSGGEIQRLALARVMLLDSSVYLLDEPSSGLDHETERMVIEMITGFVKENRKTMVMVTHSKEIAKKYSNCIVDISNGKINERQEWIT